MDTSTHNSNSGNASGNDMATLTGTHGISSATLERALALLGNGVNIEATASACGVSASRISQLLSDDSFKNAVTELRFKELQKHNAQDTAYDDIEATLTDKFKNSIPLMMRPMEILKGLQVINAQKRRGTSTQEAINDKQTVVSIALPSVIVNNFTTTQVVTNIHNQVVSVGDKDLTTMQSGTLLNSHKAAVEASLKEKVRELTNGQEHSTTPAIPTARRRDLTNV